MEEYLKAGWEHPSVILSIRHTESTRRHFQRIGSLRQPVNQFSGGLPRQCLYLMPITFLSKLTDVHRPRDVGRWPAVCFLLHLTTTLWLLPRTKTRGLCLLGPFYVSGGLLLTWDPACPCTDCATLKHSFHSIFPFGMSLTFTKIPCSLLLFLPFSASSSSSALALPSRDPKSQVLGSSLSFSTLSLNDSAFSCHLFVTEAT